MEHVNIGLRELLDKKKVWYEEQIIKERESMGRGSLPEKGNEPHGGATFKRSGHMVEDEKSL